MNNTLVITPTNIAQTIDQVGSTSNPITSAITAKSLAEVQGKVFMAKQFPRDWGTLMARLQGSCERISLAKVAEYEYPKGGTKVVGASIKLLEAVAQCYGNIHYTWKEISRDKEGHKSHCIADAWDLENNVSSSLEFEVSHFRDVGDTRRLVTSERDLYELIAANAARRVRKCLENVIPRDIVDQAREWCNETLAKKIDIQKGIDNAIDYFKEEYGITLKHVEKYFGMSRQGFTKNTYLSLQKLYTSLRDGLIEINEVFPPDEAPKDMTQKGVANKLKADDKPKKEEEQPETEIETAEKEEITALNLFGSAKKIR